MDIAVEQQTWNANDASAKMYCNNSDIFSEDKITAKLGFLASRHALDIRRARTREKLAEQQFNLVI